MGKHSSHLLTEPCRGAERADKRQLEAVHLWAQNEATSPHPSHTHCCHVPARADWAVLA